MGFNNEVATLAVNARSVGDGAGPLALSGGQGYWRAGWRGAHSTKFEIGKDVAPMRLGKELCKIVKRWFAPEENQ